ncbi:MAG: 3-deoxy-D-manno-octulosonic acid transferase [Pseudomonadota bacterium]|nr:3-deoxy-D-manno-octulosonic acid transferase [Pseudomonadota bacterium]
MHKPVRPVLEQAAWRLYGALAWLAQPLLRRKLARRSVAEPGYAHAVEERFGRYTVARPQGPGPLVWVHAVSLGETRAAALLVQALRQRLPDMRLLLTHGTATGRAEGARLLQPGDVQVWQPWDTRGAVQRFLRHFRPDVGVLMETEVWPHLVQQSAAHGVPLALTNARLSDKSLRGAQRAGWLMRPAYAALAAAWAQTEADAQRLRAIGAPVAGVLGNLKFDAQPDAALLAQGRAWRAASTRPVVMLASSREGEEADLLACIQSLARAEHGPPPVQWLIVPRHPQRFDEVAALVRDKGLSLARRSQWRASGPAPADVWLGDSLGEMPAYYALASVALLGASFAPLGGQNLIEAAACGCPLVMGPHTFNFAQAADGAEAAGAARRVPGMAEGVAAACALAADAQARTAMSQAGLAFAQAHQGAAQRTAAAVQALLAPSQRPGPSV